MAVKVRRNAIQYDIYNDLVEFSRVRNGDGLWNASGWSRRTELGVLLNDTNSWLQLCKGDGNCGFYGYGRRTEGENYVGDDLFGTTGGVWRLRQIAAAHLDVSNMTDEFTIQCSKDTLTMGVSVEANVL